MNTKSLPGSCRRMKGHLFVDSRAITTSTSPQYSREIEPYRFHRRNGKMYYVNGNEKIFLLNSLSDEEIYCGACSRVFKRPSGGLVLFTPISHLEYVFS